jgi:hypothetical protein
MRNEPTFELSRFKELAQEAVTVMSRLKSGDGNIDTSPVQEVSKMLKTLKCSSVDEFAKDVDEDSLQVLRSAAASLKPLYAERKIFRHFIGEIAGTMAKITDNRIDDERRYRANRFLRYVLQPA